MTLSEKERWELGELASAAADGWMTEAQRTRLEEVLSSSEEARRHYLRLSSVSAGAAWIAHAEIPTQRGWIPGRLRFGRGYWVGWAAAAVLAIVAGGTWYGTRPQNIRNQNGWMQNSTPGVAVLNDAYNVEWENAQEPNHVGNVLKPGALRLKSGLAQIQFLNGANVLMEGPAELELLSASEGRCTAGKVLVDVPREAHGFRLHAPYVAIADPGTGFGVDVDRGQAAIHVFRGQVEIRAGGEKLTPVEAGRALMFERNGSFKPMPANLQTFNPPTPGAWFGPFGGFGPQPPAFGMDAFGGPPMGFPGGGPGFGPGLGGPPGFGFGGFFGNSGRWKGFDPLDSVRWQLHASNERWNQIGPELETYLDAQRNANGDNGFQSPVTRAMFGLLQTENDPAASSDELKRGMQGLRHARQQAREEMEQAKSELASKLTTREEAELVASGLLQ